MKNRENDNIMHNHMFCAIIFSIMENKNTPHSPHSFHASAITPHHFSLEIIPLQDQSQLYHHQNHSNYGVQGAGPLLSSLKVIASSSTSTHTFDIVTKNVVRMGIPMISKVGNSSRTQSWCIVSILSFSLWQFSPHLTLLSLFVAHWESNMRTCLV